jgi:hypothetical protein
MSTEKEIDEDYFCPTCGKSMQLQKKDDLVIDNTKLKGKMQFWYCLNCSIEWQIDILNNILRKNVILEKE